MTEKNNIQKSELVIAKILGLLMQWGVQSSNLEFAELELDQSYLGFYLPCIDWLVDEGVIRVGSTSRYMGGDGVVINPVLSSFGLKAMGLKISLDGKSITLAEAVKDVGSSEQSYSKVGDFVGSILGGFTKSMNS